MTQAGPGATGPTAACAYLLGRTPLPHRYWYYNLKAHSRITFEAGTQTFTVLAEELDHR